ncbi:hypothetical protein OS493_039727 [Desmophyllum pertusum]|uniref:Uncharacterized protein n=1 Tax=Desmophyllum pertusum TaxID=174260 RepID=A0A9W9ZV69_9CNID|nr:hypothetical protein OS493_039727 [Desmophyllum pertusum]
MQGAAGAVCLQGEHPKFDVYIVWIKNNEQGGDINTRAKAQTPADIKVRQKGTQGLTNAMNEL